MADLNRRTLISGLTASGAVVVIPFSGHAQPAPAPAPVSPAPKFNFDDVVKRARDLSQAAFESKPPVLPEPLNRLDFDAWRDIRFRPDKALLAGSGSPYRLQTFHLGHLYHRPVTVNTIRDGIATPIPYSPNLFDYGRTKVDKPLPVNVGFAGFRLHYPLNEPRVHDEVVAFLGASYFRLLGRGQHYGLSARALTVAAGTNAEEFPFFREFWVEPPVAGSERATIFALLDSESVTGAYRFDLYPGTDSVLEVSFTLFARKPGAKIGLAPLTSMFFVGENDKRLATDYRPELHDSDGLLMQSGTGEWIWRPLRNPAKMEVATFMDRDVRGFGLMQRDRNYEHYQDLDLQYEIRPSYWIEPREGWGEGRVELVELPTTDETNDNIVASWVPKEPLQPGKPLSLGYRITATLNMPRLSPNARAINSYQTHARALGSGEAIAPGSRRFIVDFAGGDLAYYLNDGAMIEFVPTASQGKILRSFILPNAHTKGFRAAFDVQVDPGVSTDLRAFLRIGNRALTETWTFPWKAE